MVISVGALKSRNYAVVFQEISEIAKECATSEPRVVLKVIIETALLTRSEIIAASFLVAEAGGDFVKTCTGFSGGKATPEDVRLMKKTVAYKNGKVQVKASGGIRTYADMLALIKAGADRIGASAGVAIMRELAGEGIQEGTKDAY
jgi:deoxyribose-phosphate aldolase